MNTLIFAGLAAVSFGVWTVFHKLAAPHINQIFGAIVVSLTAVVFGTIVLLPQIKETQLFVNYKGILFLVLAGIAAFFIDFLALQSYSRGLPITIGGPIIIGGSIAIAAVIGFFLGESISFLKIFALILIIAGSGILASLTQ